MSHLSNLYRRAAFLTLLVSGLAVLGPAPASAAEQQQARELFDLQAHRGGIGMTVENTLAAFARALELGVSTLEMDIQITQDGVAVVTHDRQVNGNKCTDTVPVTPGDAEYPYVGDYVKNLTLQQVKTLDCGTRTLPQYSEQQSDPGARMPTLGQVFDLVKRYRAEDVMLNIETKVEAGAPQETAPREQFVQVAVDDIREADVQDQVTIQSFDWGALMRMSEVAPKLPLIALDNYEFLQVDQPGASPWLGGIDIDDHDDNPVKAAASFGASALSPVHGFPQNGTVDRPDYRPYVTKDMVEEAHATGLEVIPWTINDVPTMESLMDKGVDGIITDYPNRLRELMRERAMRLPRPYHAPPE